MIRWIREWILITLVLNVFLLIAGLILIGRDFGVKTIYTSLLHKGVVNRERI